MGSSCCLVAAIFTWHLQLFVSGVQLLVDACLPSRYLATITTKERVQTLLNWAVAWAWILTASSVLFLVNGRSSRLSRAVPQCFVLLLFLIGCFVFKYVFHFKLFKVVFHFQIYWCLLPFSNFLMSFSIFKFFEVIFYFQNFWGRLPNFIWFGQNKVA